MPKINDFPSAPTLTGTELVFISVNGSASYKTNTQAIANLAPAGGTPPTGTGFRHITAGAEDAASKLVENADVHASAAIDITKLASNVASTNASQTLTNKTVNVDDNTLVASSQALGDLLKCNGTKFVRLARGNDTQVLTSNATDVYWATPAAGSPGGSSGQLQFNNASAFGGTTGFSYSANVLATSNTCAITFAETNDTATAPLRFLVRGAGGGVAISANTDGGLEPVVDIFAAGALKFGTTNWSGTYLYGSSVEVYSSSSTYLYGGGVIGLLMLSSGMQFGASGSASFGSGTGVIGIENASSNPSTNPSGGGVLYADGGALKWRGSGGTVTTMGPADPHCPTCGRDFALEHKNDELGEHFAVCIPCMVDAVAAIGANVSAFTIMDRRPASKGQWDAAHAASKAREASVAAARVNKEPRSR